MLSRYRGKTTCSDCDGNRLKKEASYVKINKKSITDLVQLPISELVLFFEKIKLTDHEYDLSKRILKEINNRLKFINTVSYTHLTLPTICSV